MPAPPAAENPSSPTTSIPTSTSPPPTSARPSCITSKALRRRRHPTLHDLSRRSEHPISARQRRAAPTSSSPTSPAPAAAPGAAPPKPFIFSTPERSPNTSDRNMQIISQIAPHLAPDATLVYCTCSVFKKENEEMAEWILRYTSTWNNNRASKRLYYHADTLFALSSTTPIRSSLRASPLNYDPRSTSSAQTRSCTPAGSHPA